MLRPSSKVGRCREAEKEIVEGSGGSFSSASMGRRRRMLPPDQHQAAVCLQGLVRDIPFSAAATEAAAASERGNQIAWAATQLLVAIEV